jgi:hypothetical protein
VIKISQLGLEIRLCKDLCLESKGLKSSQFFMVRSLGTLGTSQRQVSLSVRCQEGVKDLRISLPLHY